MSSDVITNLRLDKQICSNRIIVVKEVNRCDSFFITSSVLGHYIKNRESVLVISMQNSFSHFQNVGLKMNYNLQKHVDSELVEFLNLGDEIVKKLLLNQSIRLEEIFAVLEDKFKAMYKKHNVVHVILDGVSHFFDLQYTLFEVNRFCNDVLKIIRSFNNSIGLIICNVANEDDNTHVMSNLLSHKAYTVLEVETLNSGWSADVSGHLTIKHLGLKFEDEYMNIIDLKPSKYLFKLFDRGVKLLAPGTV